MEKIPEGVENNFYLKKENQTSKTPQTTISIGSNSFNANKNKNWPIIVEPNNKKPGVLASPLPFTDPAAMKNDYDEQDLRNEV